MHGNSPSVSFEKMLMANQSSLCGESASSIVFYETFEARCEITAF